MRPLIALACAMLLAACGTVPSTASTGVVESAAVASLPSAGGGSAGASSGPTVAYAVKMPDGSTRSVMQAGERFQVGDRVQVTRDGRLVRP